MNRGRLKLLQIFFALFLISLTLRLFYWQVLNSDSLSAQAESQHFNFYEIPGSRGEIKTSDNYSLVTNQPSYTIFASLKELDKKPEEIKNLLLPLFLKYDLQEKITTPGKEEVRDLRKKIGEDLGNLLANDKLVWVALKKSVNEALVEEVKKLDLKGIGFKATETRFYPEASLAAQLTGFVGSDSNGADQGYFGLEGFYNAELKGRPGRFKEEVDSLGRPILVGRKVGVEAENGRSLLTTIDRTIQYIVEKKLEEGLKKYGAKQASALVMDPRTGAILAAANLPGYDQARFGQYEDKVYKNPIVGDLYEPGSTFKVITMAAALDEGKITPETRCECTGPLQSGGFTIKTWNNKYFPNSTMTEVLQHSDNIGAATAARLLGEEKFAEYVKKFGFGELTGIDLEEEVPGLVKSPQETQPIDLVTNSFGQGIGITMAQIVQAVGAIANDGKMMKPYLIAEKILPDGQKIQTNPEEVRQVISAKAANLVSAMLVENVENGHGKRAAVSGYYIGGKTGTAQVATDGVYVQNVNIGSFVGYGPIEDPRFVMLVMIKHPKTVQFAESTAAPVFGQVASFILNYLEIPPTRK